MNLWGIHSFKMKEEFEGDNLNVVVRLSRFRRGKCTWCCQVRLHSAWGCRTVPNPELLTIFVLRLSNLHCMTRRVCLRFRSFSDASVHLEGWLGFFNLKRWVCGCDNPRPLCFIYSWCQFLVSVKLRDEILTISDVQHLQNIHHG